MSGAKISYDSRLGLATFNGPGGFTQARMGLGQAEAIAEALGVPMVREAADTRSKP